MSKSNQVVTGSTFGNTIKHVEHDKALTVAFVLSANAVKVQSLAKSEQDLQIIEESARTLISLCSTDCMLSSVNRTGKFTLMLTGEHVESWVKLQGIVIRATRKQLASEKLVEQWSKDTQLIPATRYDCGITATEIQANHGTVKAHKGTASVKRYRHSKTGKVSHVVTTKPLYTVASVDNRKPLTGKPMTDTKSLRSMGFYSPLCGNNSVVEIAPSEPKPHTVAALQLYSDKHRLFVAEFYYSERLRRLRSECEQINKQIADLRTIRYMESEEQAVQLTLRKLAKELESYTQFIEEVSAKLDITQNAIRHHGKRVLAEFDAQAKEQVEKRKEQVNAAHNRKMELDKLYHVYKTVRTALSWQVNHGKERANQVKAAHELEELGKRYMESKGKSKEVDTYAQAAKVLAVSSDKWERKDAQL